MSLLDRITIEPGKMGGRPCIRGMRIRVSDILDMLAGGAAEDEFEPNDTLQEAESELGISEWIDPDTGGPAEDNVPRIEDH